MNHSWRRTQLGDIDPELRAYMTDINSVTCTNCKKLGDPDTVPSNGCEGNA